MFRFSGFTLLAASQILLLIAAPAFTARAQETTAAAQTASASANLSARSVVHVAGLPDAKEKDKGTLTLTATELRFQGAKTESVLPRTQLRAVSLGKERVELWGVKGRLLRMAIPNGGGIAAAAVMHHSVHMLTVEFRDVRGGSHAAVFDLHDADAERFFKTLSAVPVEEHAAAATGCPDGLIAVRSILLAAPSWEQTEVPAAYKALVYERVYDRLSRVKGVEHVYREGEARQGCAETTMHLAVHGYKPGNQVERASLGPVGMFVGTTKMAVDASWTNAAGQLLGRESIQASVRGESESTAIATMVAKKLAKKYASAKTAQPR